MAFTTPPGKTIYTNMAIHAEICQEIVAKWRQGETGTRRATTPFGTFTLTRGRDEHPLIRTKRNDFTSPGQQPTTDEKLTYVDIFSALKDECPLTDSAIATALLEGDARKIATPQARRAATTFWGIINCAEAARGTDSAKLARSALRMISEEQDITDTTGKRKTAALTDFLYLFKYCQSAKKGRKWEESISKGAPVSPNTHQLKQNKSPGQPERARTSSRGKRARALCGQPAGASDFFSPATPASKRQRKNNIKHCSPVITDYFQRASNANPLSPLSQNSCSTDGQESPVSTGGPRCAGQENIGGADSPSPETTVDESWLSRAFCFFSRSLSTHADQQATELQL